MKCPHCKKEVEEKEQTKKKGYVITNRFTTETIFKSTKETKREAVIEAIEKKANLSEANLSKADLSEANLSKANLSWANLSKANLSKADLSEANLSWADLSKANLSKANLSYFNYWKTNFWKSKVTNKVKEKIIERIEFEEVKE
jgi:hypothetical protein